MKKLLSKFGIFNNTKPALQNHAAKPVEIGYAIAFLNDEIGLDLFGSPKEIVEELGRRGLQINEVAHLPRTEIKAQGVRQDGPKLEFHGGPYAEAIMLLIDALAAKDLKAAELVLGKVPGMLAEGNDGASIPLIAYAAAGDLDIVKFLLNHAFSPNIPGHFGMAPLHWAAARGHIAVVDSLIASGGYPTSLGWFLLTPAEVASINGHSMLAQRLKDCAPEFYEPDMWMAFIQRMGIRKD